MKHYFSTVNNVGLTHSDMEYGELGRKVRVYFLVFKSHIDAA
jgi:response regulator of citrate/malate metabolism